MKKTKSTNISKENKMKLATIEQIKAYKELSPKKWKKSDLDLRDRDRQDLMFHVYYDTVIKYLEERAKRQSQR